MATGNQNPPENIADDHIGTKLEGDDVECIDSGYLSGVIQSQEFTSSEGDDMRIKGDVDFVQDFSGLSIDNANNLSKPETKDQPLDELWKKLYQQDEFGNTYLHAAIFQGEVEAVKAIIRKTPHQLLLDTPNDKALTPLHLAVEMRQHRLVRWLIIAGARPMPRNMLGDSPLHVAAQNQDLQCCHAILSPIQEHEKITMGLSYNPQHHKADLEQWNYEGQTCVHAAALAESTDVLRYLVSLGANVNAREGRQGYTALHYAILFKKESLAHFLLSEFKNLDVEALTYGGSGVLQLGFPVSSSLESDLLRRGAQSPFSDEEEDGEFSSDSEDDSKNFARSSNVFLAHTLVNA